MFQLNVDEDINLKELDHSNAELVFSLIDDNRKYLRKWLSWVDATNVVEDTIYYIKSVSKPDIYKGRLVLEIWYKDNLAGLIDFHGGDTIIKKVEIGYWLAESLQGKGIVTRACKACIDYAFENFKIEEVVIKCAAGNESSKKIPRRLGFKFERIEKSTQDFTGEPVDLLVFSMLKENWNRLF